VRIALPMLLLAGLLGAAGPVTELAAMHPEATLRSPVTSAVPGGTLPLAGSEFQAGQTYRLVLAGVSGEVPLLEVTADEEGSFALELQLPGGLDPGRYRVLALAPDGDGAASLDITLTAGSGMGMMQGEGMAAMGGEEGAGGMMGAMMAAPEARADEIVIERSRSGIEWGIIGLLVGLAGGFGLALLRRPAV